MAEALLSIRYLSKTFHAHKKTAEGSIPALKDITLSLFPGEAVALVGPSGCGKTSLLNIVAGFDGDFQGEVHYKGKPIAGPSPQRGVVFQQPALFPWLTAEKNISFGCRLLPNCTAPAEKAAQQLAQVGLTDFAHAYPKQLSGGMQQRVALARILIMEPELMLLDEPFAALDYQTRLQMQLLLSRIVAEKKLATLFVTHDIDEAVFLADRVLVLSPRPGKILRELAIPLPRPRPLKLLHTPEFGRLSQEILDLFAPVLF